MGAISFLIFSVLGNLIYLLIGEVFDIQSYSVTGLRFLNITKKKELQEHGEPLLQDYLM